MKTKKMREAVAACRKAVRIANEGADDWDRTDLLRFEKLLVEMDVSMTQEEILADWNFEKDRAYPEIFPVKGLDHEMAFGWGFQSGAIWLSKHVLAAREKAER